MKNTKVTIPDNVDMHVIGAPDFLTNPMSLMEQWMLCDENGYLEGNVLFDMSELVTGDEETLLDCMSNRLVGDPLLSDISYKAIGTTADGGIIVNVRGDIENCDPSSSDLEEICEKIKAAILNGGEDAIRDFIEEPVYGRPEEDIEERVDEVLDGMPILELIKYFKKYMTPNADSKPSDSFFEDFENQPFDRFLAQERFTELCARVDLPKILDYTLADSKTVEIKSYECNFWNSLNYGTSEGIYLDVGLEFLHPKHTVIPLGTFKTLEDSQEAMREMARLLADLTYTTFRFMNEHLEDFEWEGYQVRGIKDGILTSWAMNCPDIDAAMVQVQQYLKTYTGIQLFDRSKHEYSYFCQGTDGILVKCETEEECLQKAAPPEPVPVHKAPEVLNEKGENG